MDNINELFNSMEFDTQLAAATDVLAKVAAAEGVDLDILSQEELASLIQETMVAGKTAAAVEVPAVPAVEAPAPAPDATKISMLDVVTEIHKRAAERQVDLSKLSKEEYADIFNKVAEELADPEAFAEAQKVAEEEAAKLAELEAGMDHLGRVAARGFVDEFNKLAGENPFAKKDDEDDKGEEKSEKKDDEEKEDKEEEKKAMAEKVLGAAKTMLSKGGNMAHAVGAKVIKGVGGNDALGAASRGVRQAVGAGTVGAGALAAGGAAKAMTGEKKAAYIEAEAMKVARQKLLDSGIDPDTGMKLASDEEISAKAAEILKAHGWSE